MGYTESTLLPALQRRGATVVDLRALLPRNTTWPKLRRWSTRPPEAIQLVAWHYPAVPRPALPYDERARIATFARGHIAQDWGAGYHAPTLTYHWFLGGSGTVYLCNDVEAVTWHASNANGIAVGVCVDLGPDQPLTPPQLVAMQQVADVFTQDAPAIPADQADHYGHGELRDYGNATACPGNVLGPVQRYRTTGRMMPTTPEPPPQPPGGNLDMLTNAQAAAVAATLWAERGQVFVPEFALPAAWLAEWRAGRYRGLPATPELPGPDGTRIQAFDLAGAVWVPGQGVTWNA